MNNDKKQFLNSTNDKLRAKQAKEKELIKKQ